MCFLRCLWVTFNHVASQLSEIHWFLSFGVSLFFEHPPRRLQTTTTTPVLRASTPPSYYKGNGTRILGFCVHHDNLSYIPTWKPTNRISWCALTAQLVWVRHILQTRYPARPPCVSVSRHPAVVEVPPMTSTTAVSRVSTVHVVVCRLTRWGQRSGRCRR